MRLSPHDPILAKMLLFKAARSRFSDATRKRPASVNQALALAPNDRQILRNQAATLANLGRDAEARELFQRYAALTSGQLATVAQYRAYLERL